MSGHQCQPHATCEQFRRHGDELVRRHHGRTPIEATRLESRTERWARDIAVVHGATTLAAAWRSPSSGQAATPMNPQTTSPPTNGAVTHRGDADGTCSIEEGPRSMWRAWPTTATKITTMSPTATTAAHPNPTWNSARVIN